MQKKTTKSKDKFRVDETGVKTVEDEIGISGREREREREWESSP